MGVQCGLCVQYFMMKTLRLILITLFAAVACSNDAEIMPCPEIIPYPADVEMNAGTFDVAGAKVVLSGGLDSLSKAYLTSFADHISAVAGSEGGRGRIVFRQDASMSSACPGPLGKEENYSIEITPRKITVRAAGLNGFVYAVQTLKQLMPSQVYGTEQVSGVCWEVPCCTIEDSPRFGYRGMLLDVARHFYNVEEVKKFIDMMEIHKMNVFHWHLTDDQGWRVEIKKYPELTEVGSRRRHTLVGHHHTSNEYDGKPYGEGMWYSQEQIRDVVAYAASKGITVIPEIDLPGHMMGALATYPELGCTGGPYEVMGKWGISDDVLCAGKDVVYTFLEDVLAEICDMFPSQYIHIGGDECPKVRWEACPDCQKKINELGLADDEKHAAEHYLQSHVMRHMSDFLAQRGRKIIGWDEMLQGELAPGATVMAWRKTENGHKAARLGHDVIMTTRPYLYLDRYQSEDKAAEPLAIAGYLPVDMVWSFDPYKSEKEDAELLTDEQKSHVIGIQASLWTEYISTYDHLEYMLYPRMDAVSEVQWCCPENKDWDRFRKGLDRMRVVYDIMGYNYATHIWGE